MQSYRVFLENIFGFEEYKPPAPKKEDENPIQIFGTRKLLTFLEDYRIGEHLPQENIDGVQWGSSDGALKIIITPNQGIAINRLITALDGSPVWINKKLYKIKEEFAGREDHVAAEIMEHVKKIAREEIDSPARKFNDLLELTKKVASRITRVNPTFVHTGIKQVTENQFNILLSSVGGGQGQIVHSPKSANIMTGIIDISFNEDTGLVKGSMYTISAEGESSAWEIDVPYFVSYFSPSQSLEEQASSILNGVKFI